MMRRAFIAGLGSAAWSFAAHAQQRERIRRIGCLSPAAQHNHVDDALEDGLRLLGWTSDQTIKIEYRYTRGREDRVAPIVKEIVGLNFDLIVSWGPPLTRAVKQAAPATDVVFLNGYDAVEEGLVTNLALVLLRPRSP